MHVRAQWPTQFSMQVKLKGSEARLSNPVFSDRFMLVPQNVWLTPLLSQLKLLSMNLEAKVFLEHMLETLASYPGLPLLAPPLEKNKEEEGLVKLITWLTSQIVVNFKNVGEHLRILNMQTLAYLNRCTCFTPRAGSWQVLQCKHSYKVLILFITSSSSSKWAM